MRIMSNSTDYERDRTTGLLSFDSTGFTVGADTECNGSGKNYVGWNWKAGGTAVANNDGSIPTMVSVNKDMGFSITGYTGTGNSGATIGHGLGAIPSLVIIKKIKSNGTDGDRGWPVWSSELSSVRSFLYLNRSTPESADDYFKDTWPTSSLITLRGELDASYQEVNFAGDDYIMYCFTNTDMLKVGWYAGNGDDNGPFVSLPFKPAVLICKSITTDYGWSMLDSERSPSNAVKNVLYPNENNAEVDSYSIVDLLSNGFKWRIGSSNGNSWTYNSLGGKYLYLAIAEEYQKYSRGR